jgi:hypothetical protein
MPLIQRRPLGVETMCVIDSIREVLALKCVYDIYNRPTCRNTCTVPVV